MSKIYIEALKVANGSIIYRHYKQIDVLGQGSFGIVVKVQRLEDRKIFALKIIEKKRVRVKACQILINRQIDIHQRLKHPHICQFYLMFEDIDKIYLLLECIQGKTLLQKLSKERMISEKETVKIIKQILQAVQYLHSMQIIHRDLKPQNILFDLKGNVKIIDFGFACKLQYQNQRKYSICGSPKYAAPQIVGSIITNSKNYPGYSKQVDIWSVGVLAYSMIVGATPFNGTTNIKIFTQILNANPSYPQKRLSKKAIDFLNQIFQIDPTKRIKISQCWNHPFLNQYQKNIKKFSPIETSAQDPQNDKSQRSSSFLTNFSLKSLKNILSVENFKKKLGHLKSSSSVINLTQNNTETLPKCSTYLGNLTRSIKTERKVDLEQSVYLLKSQKNQLKIPKWLKFQRASTFEDTIFVTSIIKDKICLYVLSNGDKGTYQRNINIQLLYHSQSNQIFKIQNNVIHQLYFIQQKHPHIAALRSFLDTESLLLSDQQVLTNILTYVSKFYDILSLDSYVIKLSNNTYQLYNYVTYKSIIKCSNNNEILYVTLKGETILTRQHLTIDELSQNKEIMKMYQLLNKAIVKIQQQKK